MICGNLEKVARPLQRDPVDPFRPGLAAGVFLVGCLVVVGLITVVQGPVRWAGAVMFLIGLLAVISMVRHLLRPVRQEPLDEVKPPESAPFRWTGFLFAVVVLFSFFLWRALTSDEPLTMTTAIVVAAICVAVLLGPLLAIELFQRHTRGGRG